MRNRLALTRPPALELQRAVAKSMFLSCTSSCSGDGAHILSSSAQLRRSRPVFMFIAADSGGASGWHSGGRKRDKLSVEDALFCLELFTSHLKSSYLRLL